MFEVKNTTTGEMVKFNYGKNGIDWAQETLGNFDAYKYNEETEEYEMTGESIEWWVAMFARMSKVDGLFEELEEVVDDYEKYQELKLKLQNEAGDNDLEDEYAMLEQLIQEKINEFK